MDFSEPKLLQKLTSKLKVSLNLNSYPFEFIYGKPRRSMQILLSEFLAAARKK